MMIVDTHTHWGIVWEDKYGTDPGEWLRVCDRHGVAHALLMGHRALRYNTGFKRCNDTIRETCDRSDGRLWPLATVHPAFGEKAVAELERCLRDLDMRGLKIHPWLQGITLADPVMDDLAMMCGEYDVPVVFHDGTPPYAMPSQIGGLALRFPRTKFVLGHSGLLDLWRSAVSYAGRVRNLYLTLCGPHEAAMQAIVDRIDEDHLMWGSDFGFGWADSMAYRRALIDLVVMTPEKKGKIMADNACRLFKLPL